MQRENEPRTKAGFPGRVLSTGGFFLLLVLSLSACAVHRDPERLQQRYQAAVQDAAVAEPGEIYPALEPVTAQNRSLVWQGEPGKSAVRVVTWTSWSGYQENEGGEMELSRPVWVTLVPKVRDFCRGYKRRGLDRLVLRLEQLLGLPPDDGKELFAEMWVKPEDLYRPCPDPEVNDRVCSLDFPRSSALQLDPAYREWFEGNYDYGDKGYPWTRLGYTYDWKRRRRNVGLSEYVARKGASVAVIQVTSTAEYCGRVGRGEEEPRC